MNNTHQDNRHPIKTYTKAELASMYGITKKTFHKWLLKANILNDDNFYSSYLCPKDVEKIFNHFGEP